MMIVVKTNILFLSGFANNIILGSGAGGQRTYILLRRSEFESRYGLQSFCVKLVLFNGKFIKNS